MLINAANMEGMFTSYKTMANVAASDATTVDFVGLGLALDVPTNQITVNYAQMDQISGMRKWIGPREAMRQKAQDLNISCVPYERTIELLRREIESDATGLMSANVRAMGANAALYPQVMLADYLNGADSATSIDGQYLLDTDHAGASAQSNVSSNLFTYANLVTGLEAMWGFTDSEGTSIGAYASLLVVGPGNAIAANEYVGSELKPGTPNNEINGIRNMVKVVVLPTLGTKWFLVDGSKEYKPLVWQHRKMVEFDAVTDPTDSYVFINGAYLFGADADWAFGPGVWQAIYGGGF